MNQEQPITQPIKYNFLLIVLIILFTALIVGGGVYLWQKSSFSKDLQEQTQQAQQKNEELQQKINELQNQIAQLQAQKETPESEEEPTKKPDETEKAMGYIKTVYEKDGKRYLDIDYVQWLTGDEAIKAMREDGKCPVDIYPDPSYCIPNGFYIRNQNPKIRTFEISKNAEITRATAFDFSPSGKKVITYEEFKHLFTAEDSYFGSSVPFHIEVINGLVIEITEQYIP